jgi:hypothetical protein
VLFVASHISYAFLPLSVGTSASFLKSALEKMVVKYFTNLIALLLCNDYTQHTSLQKLNLSDFLA